MKKASRKRLDSVSRRIGAMPISPAVVDAAFQQFQETGELPEHQRLAAAVVGRALSGGGGFENQVVFDMRLGLKLLPRIVDDPDRAGRLESFRKSLFDEAVYGPAFVSLPARLALRVLVSAGRDVRDPEFVPYDSDIPDWGSVGWHLLGFFERLAKPPYEEQAQRLFARFEDLRARIDRDDEEWFARLAEAGCAFMHEGELPDDALLRDAVLANGEFFEFARHFMGRSDPEVMAAFDRTDAEGLQALAVAGRLVDGPIS